MSEIKSPRNPIAEFTGNSHGHQIDWQRTGSTVGSIVAGSVLAVYGVTRKSAGGLGLAAVGSILALRGIRRAATPKTVHVERSFTINRPVSEVYDYFRNFENLPKFMQHLREVRVTGEKTSRWVAEAPLGFELEWDAEIVDESQNRHLTWQSLPGTLIPNRGSVAFRAASEYHGGTEMTVVLEYLPPVGRGGALFARIFGREPSMQIREDLRRLKQLLEAGEIPTTDGQPHGRRTAFMRMVEAVNQQPKQRSKPDHADRAHSWAEVG